MQLGYSWEAVVQKKIPAGLISRISVVMPRLPSNGSIERLAPGSYFWRYRPNPGFIGFDRVEFLVKTPVKEIKVIWNLDVIEQVDENRASDACHEVFPGGKLVSNGRSVSDVGLLKAWL